MADFTIETDEDEILVEFAPLQTPGVRQVSRVALGPEEMAGKSALALDKAMSTIRHMAKRTSDTIAKITDKPTAVVLEFGIKLDAEAGAYIAKVGTEAGFKVVLTWTRPPQVQEDKATGGQGDKVTG